MLRLTVWTLVLIVGFGPVSPGHAGNPEYRCEPQTVDNDAVAVAYSDVDVGRFSNPDDKVCIFAIGGASSEGASSRDQQPPIQEVISAIGRGDVKELVIRLTLARSSVESELDDVRDSIAALLENSLRDLENCFIGLILFDEPDRPDPKIVLDESERVYLSIADASWHISCSVFKPGDHKELRSERPTLRLRAQSSGGQTDSWFVPQEAARE